MGLDMYLSAKRHLSNYDFREDEKKLNAEVKKVIGLDGYDNDTASIQVEVNVGYWRKSNQIHKWFVDECQGGVDECQETWVSPEQLDALLTLCTKALDTKDASLLPPQSGFFFGSTEVDEWYWQDLEYTKRLLTKLLSDPQLKEYDFYYRSSW